MKLTFSNTQIPQMIPFKTLNSHQFRKLLNLYLPNNINPNQNPNLIPSIFMRNISQSPQFQQKFHTQESNKKPLEDFFMEAVGLSKNDIEKDGENDKKKLKKNLEELEVELRRNKKDSKPISNTFSKPLETFFREAIGLSENGEEIKIEKDNQDLNKRVLKKLSCLFDDEKVKSRKVSEEKTEDLMDIKPLSSEMAEFATFLHSKGYLKTANFLPNNMFDVHCFENNFGRDYLKFAVENFAKDHREIQKWLPDKDLKKLAEFGCPSLGRKIVFSAKSMRLFYGIQEKTVCNKCVLKDSCKFVNQSVWKKGAKNMDFVVIMRVLTMYALDVGPAQLQIPEDVKSSVSRLLKEVVRISELES